MERIVVRTSQGYDVLEGRRLTAVPVDRATADRIARGLPPPPQPLDLRAKAWEGAGGGCGFEIR
jgi:hypothetical protein